MVIFIDIPVSIQVYELTTNGNFWLFKLYDYRNNNILGFLA